MWNVKFDHKTNFLNCLFKQRKAKKQNKTVVKFIEVFNLPVERGNNKSCQFHAANASFIPIMLI